MSETSELRGTRKRMQIFIDENVSTNSLGRACSTINIRKIHVFHSISSEARVTRNPRDVGEKRKKKWFRHNSLHENSLFANHRHGLYIFRVKTEIDIYIAVFSRLEYANFTDYNSLA